MDEWGVVGAALPNYLTNCNSYALFLPITDVKRKTSLFKSFHNDLRKLLSSVNIRQSVGAKNDTIILQSWVVVWVSEWVSGWIGGACCRVEEKRQIPNDNECTSLEK